MTVIHCCLKSLLNILFAEIQGRALLPYLFPVWVSFQNYANYAIRRPSEFMFFTWLFQEKNLVFESTRFSNLGARNLWLFLLPFFSRQYNNLSKHYIDREVLELFRISGYHAKLVPHGSLRPSAEEERIVSHDAPRFM